MSEIIRLEKMGKIYRSKGTSVEALKEIDLTIEKGDIFGIIGMSGAGKSTLVRCINLLERPTSGNVYFEGKNLLELSKKELNLTRREIAMIFQQFNLLMQRTVLKNVRYPMELMGVPKEEANAKALEYLEVVGLAEKANAYPSQLSGGQKQRVAIARALACRPKVLLCDEATSALDPKTTTQILELIKKINQELGITVIVITHEMAVIEKICNKVAIIDESRIAEFGNVSDVFSNPQTVSAKRLIYGAKESRPSVDIDKSRLIRIVFDGHSSYEPVIANMILDFKIPVNIMHAETRDLNGRAVGHMILQLPADADTYHRMIEYLRKKKMIVEEVFNNVK